MPKLRIPRDQWRLPAGVRVESGATATLREVLDPRVATVAFEDLPRRLQERLLAERIRAQPRYRLLVFGRGLVSKTRAIDEAGCRSHLGEVLVRVERSLIASVTKEALRRRRRRARGGRS